MIGLLLTTLLAAGGAESPPIRFELCTDCGIGAYAAATGMGSGLAAADFDDDGDVDLFVPNGQGTPDQLYRNLGDGRFEEIAALVGLATPEQTRCALWLDADGDGDLDLMTANDRADAPTTFRLYLQQPARGPEGFAFVDATLAAGLFVPMGPPVEPVGRHRGGLSAGDLDGDGDLDVVACMWNGWPTILRNDGGTFVDVTAASGITTTAPFSHQAVLHDFDGDGRLDVYIAVDFLWNGLWINQGDWTFVDVAPAAQADNAMNDMGIALGDPDDDGDLDLYVTNIEEFGVHNILLRNDATPSALAFTEVSEAAGVAAGSWGWGATFLDADADGRLDIAATNGWTGSPWSDDASRFWWSRGGPGVLAFDEVASAVGFDDTEWGSCLIAVDLERDGDLDLLQTCMDGPLRLLRNEPVPGANAGRFLVVRPRQAAGGNRRAIGAIVRTRVGTTVRTRVVTAGTSYLGQEPAEAHFGLGEATTVDRLEIRWPDGRVTRRDGLDADAVLTVDDADALGCAADGDGDGEVGAADLALVLGGWGPCGAACPGDLAITGAVDLEDLLLVLAGWGGCR